LREHRRRGRVAIAAAITALGLAVAAPSAVAADVSGKVFQDFNSSGIQDANAATGAVDPGIPGVTVKAYDATGAEVASATTDATGAYTLAPLPGAQVHVAVQPPSGFFSSPEQSVAAPGATANTTSALHSADLYIDASTAQTGIDFGLQIPTQYSVDNPFMYWPEQFQGPPSAAVNASKPGIRKMPFLVPTTFLNALPATASTLATFGQVGTTFGLGVDQSTGDVYAGAFYKRFAGLKVAGDYPGLTNPTGAIYRVTQAGAVDLFADIDAGTDDHPSPSAPGWNGVNRDESWDDVGLKGLGSVEVDPANEVVWTVNLADRTLDGFKLSDAAPVSAPDYKTAVPDPGCSNGDWAPFSLTFDPSDGAMYLGGVCNARTSQDPNDLLATIYRVGDPTGAAPTFTAVLSVPLGYERVPAAGSTADSEWRPWPTVAALGPGVPPNAGSRGANTSYTSAGGAGLHGVFQRDESYPQLSAIAFTSDGNMTMTFRDLMGDMSGIDSNPTQVVSFTQGDMLKACGNATAGWTLESGGLCGGVQGANLVGIYGALGPGVNPGPHPPLPSGGRYFYEPRPGYTLTGAGNGNIPTNYVGGLLALPGYGDVATTNIDDVPGGSASISGLEYYAHKTGATTHGVNDQATQGAPNGGVFGTGFNKSNGLGDIAALTQQAPVQIGDRAWFDDESTGTEDATHPPVVGLIVNLLDSTGAIVATTTTDANGRYVFSVLPNTAYRVQIPVNQAVLGGRLPTVANVGSDPRVSSKGVLNGLVNDETTVAGELPGHNNHTYDFGFTPPADLAIAKTADPTSAGVGDRVVFTLRITNNGPNIARGVSVSDVLPAGLAFESASSGCSAAGQTVTCTQASLASGAQTTFTMTAVVTAAAIVAVENSASVTSRTPDPDPSNNQSKTRITIVPPPPVAAPPGSVDLAVVKSVDHKTVDDNAPITWTVTVTNRGPGIADGVVAVDDPSLPVAFTLIRPSVGSCGAAVPVRCTLGALASGASATIILVGRARDAGSLVNTVRVSATPPDPQPANNVAKATTSVRGSVRLTKTADRTSVRAGANIGYAIRVTNPTMIGVAHVHVCDRLPSGLAFVGSSPKASRSSGRFCWSLGTVAPRSSKTVKLTTRTLRGVRGRLTNTATVSGTGVHAGTAHDRVAVLGAGVRGASPVTG
jgi:uncharacterized repeat protein (TIGR01451 family)